MRARDERGAATVVGVMLIGVLVSFAFGCAGAAAIVLAHRRAQSAADLAALAGAAAEQRGRDACAAAGEIASRNRARVSRCSVEGTDVVVTVEAPTPGMLGRTYYLPAQARAGPLRRGRGSPSWVPSGLR